MKIEAEIEQSVRRASIRLMSNALCIGVPFRHRERPNVVM